MNNVVDEVLAGQPRYTIKDNGGTTLYDNVQIDLKTAVTTQGTPLNKVLFDSIKDDLNSRLLITSKATQAQAEAGTDDTNYMTALKTRQQILKLKSTVNSTSGTSVTLYTFTNSENAIIRVEGYVGIGGMSFTLTGSTIRHVDTSGVYTSDGSSFTDNVYLNGSGNMPFFFEFNMTTKTFRATYPTYSGNVGSYTYFLNNIMGTFSSLTTLKATKNTSSNTLSATIDEVV